MNRLAPMLITLLTATQAYAFVPYKSGDRNLHWGTKDKALGLTLVQKDSPLSSDAFREVVDAAFAQWTRVGDAVPEAAVKNTVDAAASDDTHKVQFMADAWPYDPNALAVTVFSYKKSTGELVDADIFINATGPCISTKKSDDCYDLQAVLTHEAGHFMGLDHNADEHDAVMYPSAQPGDTTKRTLTSDDMAGVIATYGGKMAEVVSSAMVSTAEAATPAGQQAAAQPVQDVARQGCSAAGGSSGWGLFFMLSLLLARKTLRRAAVAVAMASAFVALPALASSASHESLVQQMDRSDAVFVARAVGKRSYFDVALGFIVTEHTLALEQCVRGNCSERMTFRTLGGEVGDLITRVAGEVEPTPGVAALFVASRRNAVTLEATAFGQGVMTLDNALGAFRSKTRLVRVDEVIK